MTKLNQVIASEKTVKSTVHANFTRLHRDSQKAPLFAGLSRTYTPLNDEGEELPPESTKVQLTADGVIKEATDELTRLFDLVATKDYGNCKAVADIVVDGLPLVKDVPVSYLLFLEKQLVDIRTFVSKLPTLDPSENWRYDENAGYWVSDEVKTIKTKKVARTLTKWEPPSPDYTQQPQVDVINEDATIGNWHTLKFSGALPATRVKQLLERVDKLTAAVKYAREEANGIEVTDQKVGGRLFNYLFSPPGSNLPQR